LEKYLPEAIDMSWNMISIIDEKLREMWIQWNTEENEISTWRYPTIFSKGKHRENTELYFEYIRRSDRFFFLLYFFSILY
jgi:hypothetical protein